MRVWKLFPSCLFALVIVACSAKPSEETTPASVAEATEANSATAPRSALAPASDPAPAPAKPAPVKAPPAPAPAVSNSHTASSAPSAALDSAPANNAQPAKPKPIPVTIPAGTELNIVLADALNSGTSKVGDEFTGNLAASVYADGATILERGTTVHGKVMEAEGSGRVSGKASLRLALTAVTHNDELVPVVTKALFVEAESTTGRDAKVVGGTAGIGAVIGAIVGGKKGAATGAAVGGGAGAGTVLATKGKEVEFPAESKITFTLDQDLNLTR